LNDASRVRRAGIVLLVLMLHALQAGATHFPRAVQKPAAQTPPAASFVGEREATTATDSGAHAQCLLCRLQRNLSVALKNSAPVAFTPPQDSLHVESASTDTTHAAPPGVACGRAPPRS
jgi:hypothetical protein